MKSFDNLYKEVVLSRLTESSFDLNRNRLDPGVFEVQEIGQPKLLSGVRGQITMQINELDKYLPIKDFYMVGSILTQKYNPNSDIDVVIELDKMDTSIIDSEVVLMLVKDANGKMAVGTTHPINYYITTGELNVEKYDGVYSIANERWLKIPQNLDIDVENYMNRFESELNQIVSSTEELRRDIIDLEELKSMPPDQLKSIKAKMSEKLDDVNKDVENMIIVQQNIKKIRNLAFDKYLTPTEARELGGRNNLPENLVYKLIQRYYYWDVINKLKEIVGDDKDIEMNDIPTIKKIGATLWKR